MTSDITWGVATAAFQIEGATAEGGRGPSHWDTFQKQPGAIVHGEDADVACDHYHRWAEDLDLMAELGIPAYRLSLSWSRLQPSGRGELNPEGVAFYRDLLQGCRERGIDPYVTLYHWDLPQPLADEGGWPARSTAEAFGQYVPRVLAELGSLAQNWITINEPICASFLSYDWGMQAPGHTSEDEAIRAAHHLLLAHGLAMRAFRAQLPTASAGITNLVARIRPASEGPADAAKADEADARMNRVFLEPVYRGAYDDLTLSLFPQLTDPELVREGDLELISAPTDLAGVNHYTNLLVHADEDSPFHGYRMEQVEPTPTSFDWSDTPDALHAVLRRMAEDYTDLPLIVTENGATFHDYPTPDGAVHDPERIHYLEGYTGAVLQARAEGIDVVGYFCWSFMDNFEWSWGYSMRFGLVYIDFATQRRIPKDSAHWYRDFIAAQHLPTNALQGELP